MKPFLMNVLTIDIGREHIRVLATGHKQNRELESGFDLTPTAMVVGVQNITEDWIYDVVSIGYPGPVWHNRPITEPHDLGKGWAAFDYRAAFKRPVKIINDAAMRALGCYKGGRMLFLGLGIGLSSAMIVDGVLEPMELGLLPYKNSTFEDHIGARGLEKHGKNKWRKRVADVVKDLIAALEPDDVVLGGGNTDKLTVLPPGCRLGDNASAFVGGFRLWKESHRRQGSTLATLRQNQRRGTRPCGRKEDKGSEA